MTAFCEFLDLLEEWISYGNFELQESVVFYSLLLLHKSAFRADTDVKYNSFHLQILDMGDSGSNFVLSFYSLSWTG